MYITIYYILVFFSNGSFNEPVINTLIITSYWFLNPASIPVKLFRYLVESFWRHVSNLEMSFLLVIFLSFDESIDELKKEQLLGNPHSPIFRFSE